MIPKNFNVLLNEFSIKLVLDSDDLYSKTDSYFAGFVIPPIT